MEFVQQEDKESGCGTACIAMLAGTTYELVRAKVWGDRQEELFFWSWKSLRAALSKFGISSEAEAITAAGVPAAFQTLVAGKSKAILWYPLASDQAKETPVGHYVVYNPEDNLIYDPLEKAPIALRNYRTPKVKVWRPQYLLITHS